MPVEPPSPAQVRLFGRSAEFRAWLEANHDSAPSLWVGYYKRAVPKTAMTYPQAVEEALCYGWIDGITYRIDDKITATRFTPRRRTSSWSAVNIARVAKLSAAGRMRPAGLRAFDERDRRKDANYSYERPVLELSGDMLGRLRADRAAWAQWQAEQASFRRQAAYWVMSAKRAETRDRRFAELLEGARAGRRPKAFIVERAER